MEQLDQLIDSIMQGNKLTKAVISHARTTAPGDYTKVTIKPVALKSGFHYQFSYHFNNKVKHENRSPEEAGPILKELFRQFRQGFLHTDQADYQVLISKKHSAKILKKAATQEELQLDHNRKKQYLLEEGKPVPFMVELGVMNAQGKVLAPKYDKFKQINRFLEMIADIVPHLPADRTARIVDFGCGKSYLTFALYHYLKDICGLSIEVVGLDLKEDVIRHCNRLAEQFGYGQLRFVVGDIGHYSAFDHVDMVVTLHACDVATDAALEKAVRWGAEVILSVPCCQHELFRQIDNPILRPLLNHGILKERFSSLVTDAVRAQLLDMMGYKTQLLEFIDMEHTPKNLLIRAVKGKQNARVELLAEQYRSFKAFLNVSPYLEKALMDKLDPHLPDREHE